MNRETREHIIDSVCASLRKSLGEGGATGLTAAFKDRDGEEIAEIVSLLTNTEAVAVFNWIDDIRGIALLAELPPEMAGYILSHIPAGRVAHLSAETPEHVLGI